MIFNFYLFGQTSSGYKQYPDDYLQLQGRCVPANKELSRLGVWRKRDLIHYAYARRIKNTNNQYLGFAIVINGLRVDSPKLLSSFMEELYLKVIKNGDVVKLSSNGELIFSVDTLSKVTYQLDLLRDFVDSWLEKNKNHLIPLPKLTTVPENGVKIFDSVTTSVKVFNDAVEHYDCVYWVECNEVPIDYISQELRRKEREKSELITQNSKLVADYNRVLRQKKQFKTVVFLSVFIFLGIIAVILYNNDMQETIFGKNEQIMSLQQDISDNLVKISELRDSISYIEEQNESLEQSKRSLERKNDKLEVQLDAVKYYMPILIKDIEMGNVYKDGTIETSFGSTIYSSNTMYLKPRIKYEGLNTGEDITLYVKLFRPNGGMSTGDKSPSGYSYSYNIYVYSGENLEELSGWGNENKGNWSSGTYRIEIWYNNVCLRSERFTVY